ncbi:MAG: hypothetical protein DI587_11010 [Variovorax paradoxus]|nr:MAG: hypothetical protein DI583_11010 [Variovorax paradoxus]PZQ10982.1 MAG: hypothetical protein DI587_11010 [Variovorax paradoxus]
MPSEANAATSQPPHLDQSPRSDPQSIPPGKDYQLALRFNKRRYGIAAFDWVALWHGSRKPDSRAFPLEAHGFAEALRGAATTILLETGMVVPEAELEMASYKERRVNDYLRQLALQEARAAATDSGVSRSRS